jgi:hypothetical protein
MADDAFDEEEALWRRVADTLLTRGASPAEAIDGANLVLGAYRRQRDATPLRAEVPIEESGMRRIGPSSVRSGQRRAG